jgi:hypothetical protein
MQKTTITLAIILGAVFAFGQIAQATELAGTYKAEGSNPGDKGNYKGNVIITKTGETYKVVWSVGLAYIGTGVVTGDVFSVAYMDEKKSWFGIVAYKIKSGGKVLEGKWCGHTGKTLGTEQLTRK